MMGSAHTDSSARVQPTGSAAALAWTDVERASRLVAELGLARIAWRQGASELVVEGACTVASTGRALAGSVEGAPSAPHPLGGPASGGSAPLGPSGAFAASAHGGGAESPDPAAPAGSGSLGDGASASRDTSGASEPSAEGASPDGIPASSERMRTVRSPLIGTFYAAPAPGAAPFAAVGEAVEAGQTLCIVEAMKVMNEICAPCAGRVLAVGKADGELVGIDDVLVTLEVL